jgi:hypothetical protein
VPMGHILLYWALYGVLRMDDLSSGKAAGVVLKR